MRPWLLALVFLVGCSPAPRPAPTSTSRPVAPTSTPIPGRPVIGSEGTLSSGGPPQWVLIVNPDDYGGVALTADAKRLGEMVNDGRAVLVDDGTRVRMLEQRWPIVKLRVLAGPQSGKEGWADYTHVR